MGRPALAIGGIALVGVGLAVGFGWWFPARIGATTTVDRQISEQIHTVRIDNIASEDVTVQAGSAPTVTVHQSFHYHGGTVPEDAYHVDGDQLVLSRCHGDCTADFQITVPPGTSVTGESSSGNITIRDTGSVDVSATSGDVEVSLAAPEDVRVHVTSGDVRVIVPEGSYRVQGRSNSGERDIQVASDPAAPHVLDLTTTSGDVIAHTA